MMQVLGATNEVFAGIPSTGCLRSYRSIESGQRRHFRRRRHLCDYKQFLSYGPFKGCRSLAIHKVAASFYKYQARGFIVRTSEGSSGDLVPLAPHAFESAIGQFLAEILQTHPHLLVPAADQQLENLQIERDTAREENAASDLLYKRIAEVKEKERRKTLEEIIYCLIVQKFVDNNISMIPKITETSDPTGCVDFWPNQEIKLESVHSPEAFEMIQGHLSVILGDRMVGPLNSIVNSSKIKLGKLYAASIMYGYFLRRVDERYQLERTMKTLPKSFPKEQVDAEEDAEPFSQLWDPDCLISVPPDDTSSRADGDGQSYRLRSYVMYLDAETLQRYARIRSNEATSLIEKQTQALFGRPDITVKEDGTIDESNDEVITVTFSGLTTLILEAVAFGSFLWDAESYVESKYHFVKSQEAFHYFCMEMFPSRGGLEKPYINLTFGIFSIGVERSIWLK